MAKRPKIGRWENLSSVEIDIESLNDTIMDILESYGDSIYLATEEGLDAAEKILINNLRAASPTIKKPPKGYVKKNFAKAWKSKGKRYKLVRYIGNTTTVIGKNGEKIALANIMEYSTTRGNPFIKDTLNRSIPEMARAVVDVIKGEV